MLVGFTFNLKSIHFPVNIKAGALEYGMSTCSKWFEKVLPEMIEEALNLHPAPVPGPSMKTDP